MKFYFGVFLDTAISPLKGPQDAPSLAAINQAARNSLQVGKAPTPPSGDAAKMPFSVLH